MGYSELVKSFGRIRDYMREFYVYGFKSRDEYKEKSARSYDDERRRLESWLGDYMQFRQTPEGKTVFLSIDSRLSRHNPLYKAWKAKSFTDGDITLHFILFDLLSDPETVLTLKEITEKTDEMLSSFDAPRLFEASTVRKKLNEYVSEGLILAEKRGKTMVYRRAESAPLPEADVLDFFSESAPCGVVGSYLLDKLPPHEELFAFKHHYITGAMDSEVVCELFLAMSEKREITLETVNRKKDKLTESRVVPLRLMISAQSGRQYLMAYVPHYKQITAFRTDHILSVKAGEISEGFVTYRQALADMEKHLWGISTKSRSGAKTEHVEFTVHFGEEEPHIPARLEREKRCGSVERIDAHTCRFSADVYDASELVPWMRTFFCRLTSFHFSDPVLEDRFRKDLEEMYRLYGLEGGECE